MSVGSRYPLPVFDSWASKEQKVCLRVDVALAELELVWPAVLGASSLGAELLDGTTLVRPGFEPEPGRAVVVANFEQGADAARARDELALAVRSARCELGFTHYHDVQKYFAQFHAFETQRLWVGPPWLVAQAPRVKKRLVIPPQDVFGCRGHPTTQLTLRFLEECRELRGASVFDVGTGTGVLAVGARLLGSGPTFGNDFLPSAVAAAKRLARACGVKASFSTRPLDSIHRTFDVVVANLTTPDWPPAAAAVVKLTGRDLFVSGFPESRREEIEALLAPLKVVGRKQLAHGSPPGLWAASALRR